jgi:LmbE family N-acetylglucosaminyl deacetylase
MMHFYCIENVIVNKKIVAIIIAHPDDETLWAGGLILSNPLWEWFIVCLSRKNDIDRALRFYYALNFYHADGIMGDLDDGPEQFPLNDTVVEQMVLNLLPQKHFDLVITHHPKGEYTKHLRHEETSKAVIELWNNGKIDASELWTFDYEDGNREYYPKAAQNATTYNTLPAEILGKKYALLTDIYGFSKNSWEAKTTPKIEAFLEYRH